MEEKEIYSKLIALTKDKEIWQENIAYVGSLLTKQSTEITAKALWIMGEMGLQYPEKVAPYVNAIALYLNSQVDLLRNRSVNALGRIGRANFELVKPYWAQIFVLAEDSSPDVRLSFIWANENIAMSTPEFYKECISVFAMLLDDENNRVRIEAPEMFRVLGKCKPEYVCPYLDKLQSLTENDEERVVRIHAAGAIKAINAQR